jgi:hypothetical protein
LLLCLAAPTAPAAAQTPEDIASAKRWFKEGEEAEKRGEYANALSNFEQALAVKATPQLYLRVGACQEKLGRLIEAEASYQEALARANAQALTPVALVAAEQIEALRPRIPVVSIAPADAYPGLSVTIDGAPVAPAALAGKMPVNPGAHQLTAEAPGYDRRVQPFTAAERDLLTLAFNLTPTAPTRPPPTPPPTPPPPPPDHTRIPTAVLITSGVAFVLGGALVGGSIALDRSIDEKCGGPTRKNCPAKQQSEIESSVVSVNIIRGTGIAVGGIAVLGAAVGIYALLRRPKAPPPAAARFLQVAPVVGPGSMGIGANGRF